MILRTVPIAIVAAALAMAAALAACAAQTPEERMIALRARYEATLNGFQVYERPVEPPAPVPVEEAAAGPPAAGPVLGEAGPPADAGAFEPPAVPVRQDVLLDIVVRNRSDERLPGLTLDVEQVDAEGEPKTTYRIYVDTSKVAPGAHGAISHRLEDVEYTPGDGFFVEVRQAILPEQRGDYREISEAGEQP